MKKGISLIAIGVMIIVISIITSVIVVNSLEYFSNVKKTKFITDLNLVDNAVKKYYLNKNAYPIIGNNENIDATIDLRISYEAYQGQFEGENVTNNLISLKKVDISKLGVDDLTYGLGKSENDFFAVSEITDTVYYVAGFEYDGKVYYKSF